MYSLGLADDVRSVQMCGPGVALDEMSVELRKDGVAVVRYSQSRVKLRQVQKASKAFNGEISLSVKSTSGEDVVLSAETKVLLFSLLSLQCQCRARSYSIPYVLLFPCSTDGSIPPLSRACARSLSLCIYLSLAMPWLVCDDYCAGTKKPDRGRQLK